MRRTCFAGIALSAILIASGCGSTREEVPPPDKSGQIARALNRFKTLQHQQRARQRAQAKLEAKETADTGAPPASASGSSIETMLAGLPGEAGLVIGAPGGNGELLGDGSQLSSVSAWSTIKVPIAERILTDAGGPSGLTSSQRENIEAAITLSDNEAAATLFSDLEATHGGLEGASTAVGEVDNSLREILSSMEVSNSAAAEGQEMYKNLRAI